MLDLRPVLFIVGWLLLALAAAMLPPAAVDFYDGNRDWLAFMAAATVTGFSGLGMALASRPGGTLRLTAREAFLVTVSIWVLGVTFGTLPFIFSGLGISFTDAFFESMSGLTTTGATVLSGLEDLPRGLLLWRQLSHWMGGIGIIVMATALFPLLRIGGMQLFRLESSEKSEKMMPRVSQVAAAIVSIYVAFTAVCAVLLWLAGLTVFDAVSHAFSTVATGGFANYDASIGQFGPAVQWIVTAFMLLGGGTFILYATLLRRNRGALFRDSQMRWYVGFVAFFAGLLALWLWVVHDWPANEAVRHGLFNVVSIVTTTGFASDDYAAWGGFAQTVFFILLFIGGCTGSTAGGIKIFRYQVLFAMAGMHLRRLLHPNGVFIIDFNRQRISDAVVRSVLGFMVLYFFSFVVVSLALTLVGLNVVDSLSAAAASLGNVGPGLGSVGPAGSYAELPAAAKWLLSAAMLLGRLELMTVLALLMPAFWRG